MQTLLNSLVNDAGTSSSVCVCVNNRRKYSYLLVYVAYLLTFYDGHVRSRVVQLILPRPFMCGVPRAALTRQREHRSVI